MVSFAAVFFVLIYFAVIILLIASFWRVYEKAGHPGWASLIPFYNIYIMLKIAGKPGWWLLLLFIPIVNIIVLIIVNIEIAKAFGKDTGYGVGLAILGFIFYPMLAFGDAQYQHADQYASLNTLDRPINVADEIHKLDQLFRNGVITFEEFEKRKAQLLK